MATVGQVDRVAVQMVLGLRVKVLMAAVTTHQEAMSHGVAAAVLVVQGTMRPFIVVVLVVLEAIV